MTGLTARGTGETGLIGSSFEYPSRGLSAPPARIFNALIRATLFVLPAVSVLLPAAPVSADEFSPGALEKPRDTLLKTYEPGDPSMMVSFGFESPVLFEPGSMIKDHAFIRAEDGYHIFYITDGEKSFGHAASNNLVEWTILDRVLWAEPEFERIWAPHVVAIEDIPGHYLMYYTGVNDRMAQETNVAISTGDLSNWIPAPPATFEPYHPDTSWALWNDRQWSNCRDPHLFTDDDGAQYLLNTATAKGNSGAISLARLGGYFDWEDVGPLYTHDNWHAIESSFLTRRSGTYHLFFVEEEVGGISYMSAPVLTGSWNIMYRAIIDNGHACELLDLGGDRSLFSRHSSYALPSGEVLYSIRVDTLSWSAAPPEVLIRDPLDPDWTILWGTAFNRQPVFGDNLHYRGVDTTDVGFEGNCWIGTYERFDGPMLGMTPGAFQGDGPRGAIRSGTFRVTGRSMRLLVGGGNMPGRCYAALCNARTGSIIYSETGRGTETMDLRTWDLEPWMGRNVYLEIVDDSSEPSGHINVDGIMESPLPAHSWIEPVVPDRLEKELVKPSKYESARGSVEMLPGTGRALSCSPNPFNPSTRIVCRAEPGRSYVIGIYDMAGRKVASLPVVIGSDGSAAAWWHGTGNGGGRVAAGLYLAAARETGAANVVAVCKLVLVR